MAKQSLMVGKSAEGVAKTLLEKFVYMDTDLYIYYNVDCRHYVLPGSEFRAFTSFAFKKGSPFIPILNSVCVCMLWFCLFFEVVSSVEILWVMP